LFTPEELANATPMYFGMLLGVRELKKARERLGLTLAQVAAKSGLAEETLSRLETGAVVNPTWQTLAKYAVAVDCKLSLNVESE
jgi:transcriptional regulator with XRE-family HTH domain